MIFIKLMTPVVLEKNIPEIANALKMSIDDVKNVARYIRYVILDDAGGFKRKDIVTEKELADYPDLKEVSGQGTGALVALAERLDVEIPYIDKVNIPLSVYEEGKNMWGDISALCADIEDRNDRLIKLLDMAAPDIIIRNEKRMILEAVNILEDSDAAGKMPLREDGVTFRRCLADVGYSLIDGWNDDMREEFDRRYEEAQKTEIEFVEEPEDDDDSFLD